jgi:BolA-like protein 1
MLSVMKRKASTLRDNIATANPNEDLALESETIADSEDRPMYRGIIAALQVLRPTKLNLIDNSHQHAGHAGSKGYNGESHFELEIVAEAFDGLNLVKRHKLIYMLLGDIMPKIHALQISAKTPSEVS